MEAKAVKPDKTGYYPVPKNHSAFLNKVEQLLAHEEDALRDDHAWSVAYVQVKFSDGDVMRYRRDK